MRPRRTGTPGAFRQNSSSSSASDVAKNAQQKATEALGSAQKIAEKGFEQLKGVGGKVGETTGNMLGSAYELYFGLGCCRMRLLGT